MISFRAGNLPLMVSFALRRHICRNTSRKVFIPEASPAFNLAVIWRSKFCLVFKGSSLRNLNSVAMSVISFCNGVPVIHHLRSAVMAHAAWHLIVLCVRISCAGNTHVRSHLFFEFGVILRTFIQDYPKPVDCIQRATGRGVLCRLPFLGKGLEAGEHNVILTQ